MDYNLRILASLRRIETQLARIYLKECEMTPSLAHLTAAITTNTTVDQSVLTLLSGMAQQIRDNIDDQAALEALAGQLDAQNIALAKAVTDNTPAAPPTPVNP